MLAILDTSSGSLTTTSGRVLHMGVELRPDQVRALAARREYLLGELAVQLGVVPGAMTNWLTGYRTIPLVKAVDLSHVLAVNLEEICQVHLRVLGARQLHDEVDDVE